MKQFSLFILIILISACSAENEKSNTKAAKKEVLEEVINGVYHEWYPGKKQIKYKGGQDEKKQRNGVWTFYSENGNELSVTVYEHGIRQGFTVVKYPNGALHYRGEYKNDKPVGIWTTYDEKGKMLSEKNFGYPEK